MEEDETTLKLLNMSLTLWKWVPLKVVGHTLVSSNKRMSVEENVLSIPLWVKN
ncbi:hypothetical protein MTR_2g045445 [Medicago truncatula]|uniref:Uncharacterized protein n=1 Tax=Medicago truncatula TaxID=3880 RepID=A0A072V8L0_MEDTR|nr:hypothetical protein MTR_2g045445 [Medicago truncatula]